jgi:hypothetical protein
MYLNNVTSTDFSGGDAETRTQSPIDTVLNADCIEVMRGLERESVDFILTDPPYLVDYRSRDGRTIRNDADDSWLKPAFSEAYRLLRRDHFCISFYGWPHADKFMAAWRAAGFRIVRAPCVPQGVCIIRATPAVSARARVPAGERLAEAARLPDSRCHRLSLHWKSFASD